MPEVNPWSGLAAGYYAGRLGGLTFVACERHVPHPTTEWWARGGWSRVRDGEPPTNLPYEAPWLRCDTCTRDAVRPVEENPAEEIRSALVALQVDYAVPMSTTLRFACPRCDRVLPAKRGDDAWARFARLCSHVLACYARAPQHAIDVLESPAGRARRALYVRRGDDPRRQALATARELPPPGAVYLVDLHAGFVDLVEAPAPAPGAPTDPPTPDPKGTEPCQPTS